MTAWSDPAYEAALQLRPARLRRTWPQRLLLTFAIGVVFSLILAATGLVWGLRRYQSISFLEVPAVESATAGAATNWLLVGSDSREGIDPDDPNAGVFLGEEVTGKRTDTIIVARVDPGRKSIDLLSLPRDLWVPIAGTGANGRINSAFNGDGGEERLVTTVEAFFDIEINNYAEVNFVGFQAVIDAVGGVPVWFDTPVRDTNSGLFIDTPGCHTLDGFSALAFARSRHLESLDGDRWREDPTGDLGRTARQQYLLSRVADTAASNVGVTNLGTVDRILRAGGENLLLDNGAGATDLLELARTFASVGSAGINRHALPVEGFRTSGGAAVLALQEEEAHATLDLFRGILPPADTGSPVPFDSFVVSVRNGARIAGIASSTADELTAAGFTVGSVGNAEEVEKTVVRYPGSLAGAAGTLGAALAVAPTYVVDESLSEVLLVVGPDYTGLVAVPSEVAAPVSDRAAPGAGENEVGVVPGDGPAGTACA